jgi:SAM-dependent methyltransferase
LDEKYLFNEAVLDYEKRRPNYEVQLFEDYECDDNKFDMLYSATAFHWIPDKIGYQKAYRILKNGGTIALFWNKPSVNSKNNPLHQKIQSLYNQFLPQWSHKVTKNDNKSRYSGIINQMEYYGFTDIEFKLYHNTRKMTGIEYIELLNTYSDHRALDKSIQLPFFSAIRTAIEEFGNELIINDTVDLYLARKA